MAAKRAAVDERQQELAIVARAIAERGRFVTYVPDKGLGAVVEGVFTSVDAYATAYPSSGASPKGKAKDPEPVDPEVKRRQAEALAFVASYTGTFGLILDIKADPRMGTKYMKLSTRQVDVILAARDRDLARAEANQIDREIHADDQYRASQSTRPEAPGLAPQRPAGPAVGRPTEGMYRLPDGTIIKVQRALHGPNLYGKRLVIAGDHGTFEYERGLLSRVLPQYRMTVDEAAEFGKLYGWCCVCGRRLTNEDSIADGIGPVCAGKV